jgi:hypothetical protein
LLDLIDHFSPFVLFFYHSEWTSTTTHRMETHWEDLAFLDSRMMWDLTVLGTLVILCSLGVLSSFTCLVGVWRRGCHIIVEVEPHPPWGLRTEVSKHNLPGLLLPPTGPSWFCLFVCLWNGDIGLVFLCVCVCVCTVVSKSACQHFVCLHVCLWLCSLSTLTSLRLLHLMFGPSPTKDPPLSCSVLVPGNMMEPLVDRPGPQIGRSSLGERMASCCSYRTLQAWLPILTWLPK